MDTTNQGHSGNILLTGPWAVPVPFMNDELLSSWLVRSALANSCDPMTLTGYIWPGWRPWTIDIDRSIPDEKLAVLALSCKAPVEIFEPIFLHNIANRISNGRLKKSSLWPWLLAIGSRNRLRTGGLQYCPACFESDEPYFRKQWRLAWHTCCETHNTLLLSRCQKCGMPLEPHRLEAEHRSIGICPSCNTNLSIAGRAKIPKQAMAFQRMADAVLQDGYSTYDNEKVTASDWFELARFFILLVKRIAKSETPALIDLGHLMGLDLSSIPEYTPQFEITDTTDRAEILGCVFSILNTDKQTLTKKLIDSGISRQGLCPKGIQLPICLTDVANALENNPISKKTRMPTTTSRIPRPRPRHEVERRAMRIRRKVYVAGS